MKTLSVWQLSKWFISVQRIPNCCCQDDGKKKERSSMNITVTAVKCAWLRCSNQKTKWHVGVIILNAWTKFRVTGWLKKYTEENCRYLTPQVCFNQVGNIKRPGVSLFISLFYSKTYGDRLTWLIRSRWRWRDFVFSTLYVINTRNDVRVNQWFLTFLAHTPSTPQPSWQTSNSSIKLNNYISCIYWLIKTTQF